MKDTIKHQGIVESTEGAHIRVRIVQTSACATCLAKGHCNASESKVKIIDVYTPEAASYSRGQAVEVMGTTRMGMQAVLWAFGLPFVLMFVVLFAVMRYTGDELVAALAALGSLVPYYLFIYMMRDRLMKKFSFTIKPIK